MTKIFLSLDIELQWSNLQIFETKLALTSPKLSEFHQKLQHKNVCLAPEKNSHFVLGYHSNIVCYNQLSSSRQFEEAGDKAVTSSV